MKSITLISFVALAVGSSASALKPRNISNNNCGRAVAGTAKGTAYESTAKADCSSNIISYTTVTITPSASTLTLTSNIQATALATSIITDIESITVTSEILSTETDQYVSTAYSTSTDIETLTIIENSTPPATTLTIGVTVTSVPVSTITSYYATVTPAGAAAATVTVVPREVQEREEQPTETEDEEDDECEVDIPETTSATSTLVSSTVFPTSTALSANSTLYTSTALPTNTTLPTSKVLLASSTLSSSTVLPVSTTSVASSVSGIPSYAAACTDFAEYVLACSLIGVYQTTSTISSILPASTITVTAISTLTTTLLETSSTELDLTFTTFETLVSTTTESSTLVISTATTNILTAYTTQIASASTISVFETTTVTAAASIQTITASVPTFKLHMTPASGSGTTYYMQIVGSALGYTSTTDVSAATVFTIDTAGRLVTTTVAPVVACAYNSLPDYYMEAIPYAYLDTHAQFFTALKCSISGSLQVICAYNSATSFVYVASQSSFFYATAGYNGYPTYIATAVVQ